METRCDRKLKKKKIASQQQNPNNFNINKFFSSSFHFFLNKPWKKHLCAPKCIFLAFSCSTPYFGSTGPNPGLTCYDVIRLPTSNYKNWLYCAFVRFFYIFPFPAGIFLSYSPDLLTSFIHEVNLEKNKTQQTNKTGPAPPWCFIVLPHHTHSVVVLFSFDIPD